MTEKVERNKGKRVKNSCEKPVLAYQLSITIFFLLPLSVPWSLSLEPGNSSLSLPLGATNLSHQFQPPCVTVPSPSSPPQLQQHSLTLRRGSRPAAASPQHSPSPSVINSGHHRPLFPTRPRPEESPLSPLHNGINHFSLWHTRKIAKNTVHHLHVYAETRLLFVNSNRVGSGTRPDPEINGTGSSPYACSPGGLAAQPAPKRNIYIYI